MSRKRTQDESAATARRDNPRTLFRWSGFSMVEVQVALVLFGVALAGIGPYMVMYTKQLRNLQQRFHPQTTYYLVPATDSWTRRLGAAAALASQDPGSLPPAGAQPPPQNTIEIDSLDHSLANEEVTAHVTVQTVPP